MFIQKFGKTILGLHNSNKKSFLCALFIVIYAIIVLTFLFGLFSNDYTLDSDDFKVYILIYILLTFSIVIIHLWSYMSVKFCLRIDEVGSYLKSKADDLYARIWNEAIRRMSPSPFNVHSTLECVLKISYFLYWSIITVIGFFCFDRLQIYNLHSIRFYSKNGGTIDHFWLLLGILFFSIGLILNYYSCWTSMVFIIFLKDVANAASKLEFNHSKPSDTVGFRKLMHASSRVAIAFFCESMLYIVFVSLAICIGYNGRLYDRWLYIGLGIFFSLLPAVITFLAVLILPKVYLARLLRRWKWLAADEVEKYPETNYKSESMHSILNDEMPISKTETIFTVITLIIDAISVILSLVNLFYK